MKKFTRLVVFLLLLGCTSVGALAEGIDGLWGGLTYQSNGDITFVDGDQWGFYFEDDVCYYAYCIDGEWVCLEENPVGFIKARDYDPNTYELNWKDLFTLKGGKLFLKSEGKVSLLKRIVSIKPKKVSMAEFQKKTKKYSKTK